MNTSWKDVPQKNSKTAKSLKNALQEKSNFLIVETDFVAFEYSMYASCIKNTSFIV